MEALALKSLPEIEVERPRAIIDRRALRGAVAEIAGAGLSAVEARQRILAALKEALAGGRAEIRGRFDRGAPGRAVVRAQCHLVDQMVRVVFDHVSEHMHPPGSASTGELLSLVAVGGYGRGEMAPHSDVDLLFLISYKLTPRSEQVIEDVLYFLWDLGLKVGQATRSVDDCLRQAKTDLTICTSLLEARWLWGDQDLYRTLRKRFQKEVAAVRGATRFIEAKLSERAARHKRLGGSRYSLEPNIKEGKGGLRDLHTLYWIGKFLYQVDDVAELTARGVFTKTEARRFDKAQNFL